MSEAANAPVASRTLFRRLGWILAALVLIPFAVVLWQKLAQKPPPRAAPPQIAKVAQATLGDMPVVLNELGTVMPTATVTVMPNQAVSGYLVDVPFQEGQDVQKGQLLAQIDPRPFQAALDQATGTLQRDQGLLNEAKMDLVRFQKLVKLDSIARQQAADHRSRARRRRLSVRPLSRRPRRIQRAAAPLQEPHVAVELRLPVA